MKKLVIALVIAGFAACTSNNTTQISTSDSTQVDSTKCDTVCNDSNMPVKCLK